MSLTDDLTHEWRCWREDGSYGPPCISPKDRRRHKWRSRHWDCCWIEYRELGNANTPEGFDD